MLEKELEITIDHPHLTVVKGRLSEPQEDNRSAAFLLAHGAGAPMDSTFMEAAARGLVGLGFPVLRFAYPYMQRRAEDGVKRPPDPAGRLEACHGKALEVLRELYPAPIRLVMAGKSLGGRMSSHLAAKGEACSGLVYLGYPLHPPKKVNEEPKKMRTEHFPAIVQPSLFVQGTRDALCDLELLKASLPHYGGQHELHIVQGGDHSLDLLKRPKENWRSPEQVMDAVMLAIDDWVKRCLDA